MTSEATCVKNMKDLEDRLEKKIEERCDDIYKAIDEKVSWKHFTWIVSTVLGLYVVISAAIWLDLREMKGKIEESQLAINSISTVLSQAEITK